MNKDDIFINYKIPHVTGPPNTVQETSGSAQLDEPHESNNSANEPPSSTKNTTAISNRFIPPGKHGTNYQPPPPQRVPKRKYDELTADKAMFTGRDPSYPEELNALIHPVKCSLCNSEMNSMQSAKTHYESKSHDRSLTAWLKAHYTDKNLEPPEIKRLFKKGPAGPNAFHCELCDIKLTSLAHANQHFSGRKHRLVASNISKPSGTGSYNEEGKWVRTGKKLVPTMVSNDGRFGIGEHFKQLAAATEVLDTLSAQSVVTPEADTTPKTDPNENVEDCLKVAELSSLAEDDSALGDCPLTCKLCGVSTTSAQQLEMHFKGAKHRKKLSLDVSEVKGSLRTTETEKIDSMYRTPSGVFYCKDCNISILNASALQQHLQSKKHLRKLADLKENKTNDQKGSNAK